ncbi:efflux transporter outer membrane subunit [Ancylobacter sp.]|uniref:efflux transporter outer membrane subunit n=1 Tax=Ancylobacter sp. TaxID=1872567 RepID=UPI003C7A21AB
MLFGGLLLAGCASSVLESSDEPTSVSVSAYASTERIEAPRSLTGWWRTFHDPVLDHLVERVAAENLTLAQARARLVAGRAQASAAHSLFLPTLGAGGTAIGATSKVENTDPLRRPLMAGFDMSWDVGLFGLSENTARSADAGEAILAADVEAIRVAMTAEVASAYISLRAVQQQQVLTAALVSALRRRMQGGAALVRSGLTTAAAEVDVSAAVAEAEVEQAHLEARANALRHQIATLLGTSTPDAALLRTGDQPQSTQAPNESRSNDLLRARPDVRAAEQKVLQAAAEIGIAQAGLYPRLRLMGTIGVGAPFTNSAFGVAGGPVLEIPLLDYGRRQAAVKARQALYDEAVAAYRQSVLVAYQEAATAQDQWRASRAATLQQRSALEAAERKAREVRVLNGEGLADRSRLAEADVSVLDRRRRLVLARESEALSLAAFYKAIGGASPSVTGAGQR